MICMRPTVRTFGVTAAVAATLMVAACGDSSSDSGGSADPDAPIAVKVSSLNLCDERYLYWGVEKGVFAEHGLDVTVVPGVGGAPGIAALQPGEVNLAFTDPFSIFRAEEQGIDLTVVSAAYTSAQPPAPQAGGVAVKKGSDISGAADLEGKTVAVNELAGINQIMIENWVREADGDPSKVEFVALPFPELGPAVVSGRVDAGQLPASALAMNSDALDSIGNAFTSATGGYAIYATYTGMTDWIKDHPGVEDRWLAAMNESIEQIHDPANEAESFEIASAVCKTPAATLLELPGNTITSSIDMAVLEDMAQMALKSEQLESAPDLESLVVPAVRLG